MTLLCLSCFRRGLLFLLFHRLTFPYVLWDRMAGLTIVLRGVTVINVFPLLLQFLFTVTCVVLPVRIKVLVLVGDIPGWFLLQCFYISLQIMNARKVLRFLLKLGYSVHFIINIFYFDQFSYFQAWVSLQHSLNYSFSERNFSPVWHGKLTLHYVISEFSLSSRAKLTLRSTHSSLMCRTRATVHTKTLLFNHKQQASVGAPISERRACFGEIIAAGTPLVSMIAFLSRPYSVWSLL